MRAGRRSLDRRQRGLVDLTNYGLRLVVDYGADQRFLIREVVIDLRAADARRSADSSSVVPRHALLKDEASRGRHDPLPGLLTLAGKLARAPRARWRAGHASTFSISGLDIPLLPEILDRATQLIQEVTVTSDLTIAEQVADITALGRRSPPTWPRRSRPSNATWPWQGSRAGRPGPGDRMPDGNLIDVAGQPTSLAEALGSRPGVIVFYRGGWCPYCDIALRTYQAQLVPALADRGIPLVAVSPQTPDGSLSTKETKELTFTVLSDPGNQIAGQLGILTAPSDGARAAQLQLGLDLTRSTPMDNGAAYAHSHRRRRVRVIRWIDVHRDYTSRTEPDQVLQAITQTIG